MKKLFISLLLVVTTVMSANAMSKYRASREARFLTDKMAWELDLTYGQMEDVYEINYDYFRALVSVHSRYDMAYEIRNEELSYVLTPLQWERFLLHEYFVTPVRVVGYSWVFPIYNHYRRDRFYYDAPHAYSHYTGIHAHHHDYYRGRRDIHIHSFNHGYKPKSSGHIGHAHGMTRREADRAYQANPYRGGHNGGHQAQPNHNNNGHHQAQPNHNNNGHHQAQPSRSDNGHKAQSETRRGNNNHSTQSRSTTNRSQSHEARQSSSSTRSNSSSSSARPSRSQSNHSNQSSTRSNSSSNRGGHAGGGRR